MATFEDGKDDGALRTIGEVARATGIKTHVLRYWEQQFPQLQPLKRSGGRRYYRTEDVTLVQTIDRLVNREGYTLRGAKAALSGSQEQHEAAQPNIAPTNTGRTALLTRLKTIREDLQRALTA